MWDLRNESLSSKLQPYLEVPSSCWPGQACMNSCSLLAFTDRTLLTAGHTCSFNTKLVVDTVYCITQATLGSTHYIWSHCIVWT